MKSRIKLFIGMAFAGVAMLAVSQSDNLATAALRPNLPGECYSQAEVELLMKGNHWSKEEAEMLLKLACQFSKRSHSLHESIDKTLN